MKVYTTDVPQCMTGASGFAILHGREDSSQKILLSRQDRMSFQSGTEDEWSSAEMQGVGELQSMTIGLHEPVRPGALPKSPAEHIGCLHCVRSTSIITT